MKLEDIAEVLRFQDRRDINLAWKEPTPKTHVWKEVKIEDFDPMTGFVMKEGLGVVGLYKAPRKYVLRKFDILLYCNGTKDQIGRVGLIIEDLTAVSSRALCILRSFRDEALPLYFFLRQPTVKAEIIRHAAHDTTGNKAFISQEKLRTYEIDHVFLKGVAQSEEKMLKLIGDYRDSRETQKKALDDIEYGMYTAAPEGWENWEKD